jgi:diguanylate cyclase (GGDEF)-like protein
MRDTRPGALPPADLAALLDASPNAVVVLDHKGGVVYRNRAAESLFGAAGSALDALLARTHPDDGAALKEILAAADGEPAPARLIRFQVAGEGWRYYETAARRLPGAAKRPLVGLFCSPRPSADTQGRHDGLTQLPNRSAFIERLQRSLARARQRADYSFALLVLDLDRFSFINNTLGARGGDEVLTTTAGRLLACVRPGDMVARIGSAQFGVIADHMHADPAVDAAHVAQRLQSVAMAQVDEQARTLLVDATRVADRIQTQALGTPFALGAHEVFASASIGIAVSVAGYEVAEEMFRDADAAMHRAKAKGGGRHEIFDREMHARASERLRLETDLHRAVERRQFCLYYQPIVALDDRRITGFEALLRWAHPERGLLEPEQFLAVAEERGVLLQISVPLLREACLQVKTWRDSRPAWARLSISANLSGHTFEAAELLPAVEALLREMAPAKGFLILELTESVMVRSVESAAVTLTVLKDLGVEVHIDDFGTGYSSLSYLHRLPIAAIKIDQSFTQRVTADAGAERMVRTIVDLGHSLGRTVIAEGIETAEQLDAMRRLGCDLGQGYLFSPPVQPVRAEALLRRPTWKTRGKRA